MAQTVWHLISLHLEAGVLLILKYGIHNSLHMTECKNSCSKITLIYRRAVEVTNRNKLLLTFQKTTYVCKFLPLGYLSYIYIRPLALLGTGDTWRCKGNFCCLFINLGLTFVDLYHFWQLKVSALEKMCIPMNVPLPKAWLFMDAAANKLHWCCSLHSLKGLCHPSANAEHLLSIFHPHLLHTCTNQMLGMFSCGQKGRGAWLSSPTLAGTAVIHNSGQKEKRSWTRGWERMGRMWSTELTCCKQRTPKQQIELSLTPQLVLHSFCFNWDSSGIIIELILKYFSQNSEF